MENSEFKILIVDDIPKNIQVVGNILQEYDFDIYFANNGINALRQIENHIFDLILLDIMMPEMDGYEVCRRIKQNESSKETPVIFLTAKTDIESIVKGFELGGVDYVTKPFNGTELIARIKTHLSLKDAKEKLKKQKLEIENQKQELQEAYNKLSESEKQFKDLNITKDKFFSIVAHDLKNPFNTLIGFTDILMHTENDIPEANLLQIYKALHNAASQGFMLLENLLEWSRAQTGSLENIPENFDLFGIVAENISLLQSTADKKQIKLSFNLPKGTIVYADRNMINTVIRNLITNALKFTEKDGKVMVYVAHENNFVIVTVEDTGIGIRAEKIPVLFRIDVNSSTPGTEKEKGTGLGLILCKEFIEMNGGKIWVESQPKVGSKFIFSLPAENKL